MATSYVFAGKPYNLGFNVSVSAKKTVEVKVLKVDVGVALDLSLATVNYDMNLWLLQGTVRIFVNPSTGPNINIPFDYITPIHIII
mmetsp:Transcript_20236/g.16928  ORF Transcript_20236/g.16928 Transcript_20236/m.16928 type:complete len:86 (-) Transcript_20236:104-361(-)